VLAMLFARAEERPFHLPGGDGTVIMVAGVWAALLVFYRLLDTPSTNLRGANLATNVGLKWGIFVALGSAIALAVGGSRVRAANHPEPALLTEPKAPPAGRGSQGARSPTPGPGPQDQAPGTAATTALPARGGTRRRGTREEPFEGQLTIEDADPPEPPTLEHER
jgi:hypothetical protein